MPRGPEIPLAIRHVAIAYFFDLDMRQTDICHRLGISKQSLSVLISRTRERCPSYSDPEKAGPTPEELTMLCAAAAVKQRSGRPRRADGGGRCSACGAPRLRTKKARRAAAEFNAREEEARRAAGGVVAAEGGGSGVLVGGNGEGLDEDGDEDDDDSGEDDDAATAAAAALAPLSAPGPAPTGDENGDASNGRMYLPPIATATTAPSTSAPAHAPPPTAYPTSASPYPPGPMAIPGVPMVNGIVSQGGGNWFYGNNGWEMYGRRDGGSGNGQVPAGHGGDYGL